MAPPASGTGSADATIPSPVCSEDSSKAEIRRRSNGVAARAGTPPQPFPSQRKRMTGHVLREEDRSGAGAPHRHPLCGTFAELRNDPVALRELPDRRALAARDDEPVDVVELLWPTHVDPLRTHAAEGGEVLAEIALETEDADARRRRGGDLTG